MEISEEEVMSLSSAIQKRYGVDFTCYEIKSLKRRIIRIINVYKFNSIFELWQKVLTDPSFVQTFKNEVSVGLTAMMRDPQLWVFLKAYLDDYLNKNGSLKVWHAGCSTGEEVYSLGMVLQEIDGAHKTKRLATDLSSRSIATAKEGIYQLPLLKDYKLNYNVYNKFSNFEKYYETVDAKHFKMNPDLLQNVEFLDHNLVTDEYPKGFDVIFCRNVLIYFDAETKLKVLRQFHKSLKKGGILIIGFFDSFIPFNKEKIFEYLDTDVRVLMKKEED